MGNAERRRSDPPVGPGGGPPPDEVDWMIRLIQNIGLSEKVQEIPVLRDVLYRILMQSFRMIGGPATCMAFYLHFLYLLGFLFFMVTGKKPYLIEAVFALVGFGIVMLKALAKPLLIASFIGDYLVGPVSWKVWNWFRYSMGFFFSAMLVTLHILSSVFELLLKGFLPLIVETLNRVLTVVYSVLPAQGDLAYVIAVRLVEYVDGSGERLIFRWITVFVLSVLSVVVIASALGRFGTGTPEKSEDVEKITKGRRVFY